MSQHLDAYPELERDLKFYPLGVNNPTVLSPVQIDRYNDQGYLFPIRVFDDREIVEIREYFDALVDSFRSPHLWKREGDTWRLRYAVWQ